MATPDRETIPETILDGQPSTLSPPSPSLSPVHEEEEEEEEEEVYYPRCSSPGEVATFQPFLRPKEAYLLGMDQRKCSSADRCEVFVRSDGERGVRAKRQLMQNEFVCEYEANILSGEEAERRERQYQEDGDDDIYMLQVTCTLRVPLTLKTSAHYQLCFILY